MAEHVKIEATPVHFEDGINLTIPKDYGDKDVLFKIQKQREHKPHEQKFRSFCFTLKNNYIKSNNKNIHVSHLFELLKKHKLSDTLPITIDFDSDTSGVNVSKFARFQKIDWTPAAYSGPRVWYFDWFGIKCSITGTNNTSWDNFSALYLRVHDMTPYLGERILDEIIEELLKTWISPLPSKSLIIYTTKRSVTGYQWAQSCTRLQRDISTIYIDKEIKTSLVTRLEKFYNSSAMYDRYGVTWKRIHLFHGLPGSGKTSTILALASIFNKNICKLTLTPDLNSQDLETLFQNVPNDSFMLLEDVDGLFIERNSEKSIDFSTILNCIDGIGTKRGLVLFMTTNHITKLDSAFIRPGRIDYSLEFKFPGRQELAEALKVLGAKYESEHEKFLDEIAIPSNMSIALLQKHLFDCIMDEKDSIMFQPI